MPNVFINRMSATFGVRQAGCVHRMKAVALAVGRTVDKEFLEISQAIINSRGKTHPELAREVHKIISDMIERITATVGNHLVNGAKWGYRASVDAFLAGCTSEQLSWVALSHIQNPRSVRLQEQDVIRWSNEDAKQLLNSLNLTSRQADELDSAAESLGLRGGIVGVIRALMNSYPDTAPLETIRAGIQERIRVTSGKMTKEDIERNQNKGVGRIGVTAPESLASWWNQGFHQMPEAQKKAILNEYLFPPPSAEKIREWTERPTNTFGRQGMSWRDRLTTNSRLIVNPDQMSQLIANTVSQGASLEQLRATISPHMQNYKVSAERVARMELARVFSETNEAVYDEEEDVIDGMQMNAVLDIVTRAAHAARHGKIWWKADANTYSQRPSLPDDYNCRCYWAPVLKPPKGIENNPELAKAYESAAGPTMDPLVYGDWWDKANPQERALVVGGRRYHEISKKLGDVAPKFTDFIDQAGELRSLKDLRKASAAEILTWRAENDATADKLRNLLREIQTKSFISPDHRVDVKIIEPAKKRETELTPAGEGFPVGWMKVTTFDKNNKPRTSYMGPDGAKYRSLAAAKKHLAELEAAEKAAAAPKHRTPEEVWAEFIKRAEGNPYDLWEARKEAFKITYNRYADELSDYNGPPEGRDALLKKRNDEYEKYTNHLKTREDAAKEHRAMLMEIAAAKEPITMTADHIKKSTKQLKATVEESIKFLSAMTESKIKDENGNIVDRPELRSFKVESHGGNYRANARWWEQKIDLKQTQEHSVAVHEMGHLYEADKRVRQAANDFVDKRANIPGQGLIPLKRIFPNSTYKRDEVTRPGWRAFIESMGGEWEAAYVAKKYQAYRVHEGIPSTELISMGVQKLWENPAVFARSDKDYFIFLIKALRGTP